jgi:hypothetical protein
VRPWQHAISSGGDEWTQDLKIHELLDSTKDLCPDLRHRMILHNCDLGPRILAHRFPNHEQLQSIALRHVAEDLDCEPSLEDWLKLCNLGRLPIIPYRYRSTAIVNAVEAVSNKFHLEDTRPVSEIFEFLTLPTKLAGSTALPVLFNSFGPSLVRQVFGQAKVMPGIRAQRIVFDPAHAAEAIIYFVYGRIPMLVEVVSAVRKPPGSKCNKIEMEFEDANKY